MIRAILCAVATTAAGVPMRARRRRKYCPRPDLLRYRVWVAQRRAWAARLAPGPVLELRTLPPLILFLGHRPSQEAKCAEVGKRDRSGPTSVNRDQSGLLPDAGDLHQVGAHQRLQLNAQRHGPTRGARRIRGRHRGVFERPDPERRFPDHIPPGAAASEL